MFDLETEKYLKETHLQMQFNEMRSMINQMEEQLKMYDATTGIEYIKPLRYMMCEALSDLYKIKHDRIDGADDLLNRITER